MRISLCALAGQCATGVHLLALDRLLDLSRARHGGVDEPGHDAASAKQNCSHAHVRCAKATTCLPLPPSQNTGWACRLRRLWIKTGTLANTCPMVAAASCLTRPYLKHGYEHQTQLACTNNACRVSRGACSCCNQRGASHAVYPRTLCCEQHVAACSQQTLFASSVVHPKPRCPQSNITNHLSPAARALKPEEMLQLAAYGNDYLAAKYNISLDDLRALNRMNQIFVRLGVHETRPMKTLQMYTVCGR